MIGKLRGAVAGSIDYDDTEPEAYLEAGQSLGSEEFEVSEIEVESREETVKIFVSRPAEAAYFEEMDVHTPTIIGNAQPDLSEDSIVEPARKEKIAVAEPADLFINALRRPVRERFDMSKPLYKKKAVEVPVAETSVIETPVVEAPVAEAPAVEEIPAPQIVVESIQVEQVETVTVEAPVAEVPVVEAPVESEEVDLSLFETFEAEESKIECEIAHKASDAYASETVVEEITVEDSEPIVEEAPVAEAVPSTVVLALPRKIELPALEAPKTDEVPMAEVESFEFETAETSAEAVEQEIVITPNVIETKVMPVVIVKEERDVLFAFRPELTDEEADFLATTYDDNLAFREDKLDETELRMKTLREYYTDVTCFRAMPVF